MQILEDLTSEQLAAATSGEVSTLVSAGAGTGKTRVLTARIAYLAAGSRLPASSIMAVTFTRKAANEITERVVEYVGDAARGLRIGTFHSLANRILRRHAAACGLADSNYGIVSEEEARDMMRTAAANPFAYGPFEPKPDMDEAAAKLALKDWTEGLNAFADRALRQVSNWKSWGLTADMAADSRREERDEETERLAAAYSAYQFELESRNLCDFGDLILKVVTLFDRHPDILALEASRIGHVLVDEAQDANQVQIRLVRQLTSKCGALTVVGDDDQNIYGFQGGYAGAMRDMAGQGSKTFALTENRRCTQEILRPANQIVDYNTRRSPKVLVSPRHGAPVRTTGHPTDASEAAWIAGRIAELVADGADPAQIAVLFRSSYIMPPFEEALARKGVAAVMSTGTSMMEREEIKDTMAMVRLALNPRDDLSFLRVANKPSRNLGTSACEGILNIARTRDVEIHEACLIACEEGNGVSLNKTAKAGAGKLARALYMLSEDGRYGRVPYDIIATGLSELDYDRHVEKQDNPDQRRANIESVHRLSEAYEEASAFLQDMALVGDAAGDTAADLGKVRLITIHASKGLEFDHVFCPGFDFGVMPNQRAVDEDNPGKVGDLWRGPSGGGLEEERRLAHVAFTRARKTLDVSFPWRRGKMRKKTKLAGPSFFIEECELKYEDMESVSTADLGKVREANALEGRSGFA